MISFNSNKKLEIAWKSSKICNEEKNEAEIVKKEVKDYITSFRDIKEQLEYINSFLEEKMNNTISIIIYLYPNLPFKEAVEKIYTELKKIDEKYENIEEEKIVKYFRTDKDFEDMLKEEGFNKNLIAKAIYLKNAIDAVNNCDIF